MTTTMKRSDGVGVGVGHLGVDGIIKKNKKKKGVSYCRMNNGKARKINVPLKRNTASISRSLQNLFDCCRRVFEGSVRSAVPLPDHVQRLCCILDSMKAEDVGLSRDLPFFKPKSDEEESYPIRVTSATIYKSESFEICIFFLPANSVIPLHNHPEMTVFNKLLLGTMHIKSYDWVRPHPHALDLTSRLRLGKLKANRKLTAPCNASVLYPTTGGNIHEFRAITACAMLDVLGPPYSKDDGRDCSYYKDHPCQTFSLPDNEETRTKVKVQGEDESDIKGWAWLEEIQIPEELEMKRIGYMGPQVIC